jgi:ribose transport system permease protein
MVVSEGIDRARKGKSSAIWENLLRISMREAGVAVALVLIVLFFSVTAPYFATSGNFLKIFVQIAINTVLAAGMTFVILAGGIDLSVGSVLALCTVVGATIMTDERLSAGTSITLAFFACLGTGWRDPRRLVHPALHGVRALHLRGRHQ